MEVFSFTYKTVCVNVDETVLQGFELRPSEKFIRRLKEEKDTSCKLLLALSVMVLLNCATGSGASACNNEPTQVC